MTDLKWYVSFASAGCLPDNDPVEFDTEAEAVAYAETEWDEWFIEGIAEGNLYGFQIYQA